jgi:hypothetical protein
LVLGQQGFRHTDGFGEVVSGGAVGDPDTHGQLLCVRRLRISRSRRVSPPTQFKITP